MKVDQDFSAAIFNADFEKAARLLAEDADINKVTTTMEPDERGMYEDTTTYLIEAALRGRVETVRFLLANGADPNIAGKFTGQTALLAATPTRMPRSSAVFCWLEPGSLFVVSVSTEREEPKRGRLSGC